jgi:hypothetical protein
MVHAGQSCNAQKFACYSYKLSTVSAVPFVPVLALPGKYAHGTDRTTPILVDPAPAVIRLHFGGGTGVSLDHAQCETTWRLPGAFSAP